MDKAFSETCKFGSVQYWKNVWFYYRIHIIAVGIAIVFLATGIYGCVSADKPDLTFIYMSTLGLESYDDAQDYLGTVVQDINGDGKNYVSVMNMPIGDGTNIEMSSAYASKADVELMHGDPNVFVANEKYSKRYKDLECFTYLDEIADKYNVSEEKRVKETVSGKTVAIDISGTGFMKNINAYDTEPTHIFLKRFDEKKKDDEKYVAMYSETVRFLEQILSGQI